MTKIQEIIEFLTELKAGVDEKLEAERKKGWDESPAYKHHYTFTEGQSYELGYVLEKIWKIISEE